MHHRWHTKIYLYWYKRIFAVCMTLPLCLTLCGDAIFKLCRDGTTKGSTNVLVHTVAVNVLTILCVAMNQLKYWICSSRISKLHYHLIQEKISYYQFPLILYIIAHNITFLAWTCFKAFWNLCKETRLVLNLLQRKQNTN